MTAAHTTSRDDALALLAKVRADLIAAARRIARELAERDGTTNARAVRDAMEERGEMRGYDGRDNWLGAVFNPREWVKVPGQFVQARSERIHARPVPVWRLRTPGDDVHHPCPHCGGTGIASGQ
jgi:hypothetical protein